MNFLHSLFLIFLLFLSLLCISFHLPFMLPYHAVINSSEELKVEQFLRSPLPLLLVLVILPFFFPPSFSPSSSF